MKNSLLIILFICSICTGNAYNGQLDSVLHVLDKTIQNKEIYTEKKEKYIDSLKMRLNSSSNVNDKISFTKEICLEYIVFMTDSALLYTRELEKYAKQTDDYEEYIDSELFRIRILKTMGLLKESSDILEKVDTLKISNDLKTFYLYTQLSVYNLLRDASGNNEERKKYQMLADTLRNRLASGAELSPMDHIYVNTERLIREKNMTRL